jgi:hypothetical protein
MTTEHCCSHSLRSTFAQTIYTPLDETSVVLLLFNPVPCYAAAAAVGDTIAATSTATTAATSTATAATAAAAVPVQPARVLTSAVAGCCSQCIVQL